MKITLSPLFGFLLLAAPAAVQAQSTQTILMSAIGGYVLTNGNYKCHVFSNSGPFIILSGHGTIESLVVGGGGSGGTGADGAGGGGAGGMISTKPGNSYLYGPGYYWVNVGMGGNNGTSYGSANGQNSSLGPYVSVSGPDILAYGGGGGGPNGGAGGSGGGQAGVSGSAGSGEHGIQYGASVTEGNGGGGGYHDSADHGAGGGGGGALAPGGSVAYQDYHPGAGGSGKLSPLVTSNAVFDTSYAGGGSGGDSLGNNQGGSIGGGGGFAYPNGLPGTNNTGGGGGGGSHGSAGYFAGAPGGSGIVILKYQFQK